MENVKNQTILSAGAGAAIGYGAYNASKLAMGVPYYIGITRSLVRTPQYGDEYLKLAQKIIKDEKLPIKIVSPEQMPQKLNIKPKNFFQKLMLKIFNIEKRYESALNRTKKGCNAFFSSGRKAVCINKDKLTAPVFHEIGHAINHYKSNFWKKIQNLRGLALIAPFALLGISLLTPKKSEEDKEKQGIIGKTTTFIKENVGKLTALAMTPLLAEELMASHRGNKIAKKYLSGDALKSVLKTNKISALSYSGIIAISSLSAYLGNKVRDLIAHKK